ncbi:MAG: TonB-dependent receptor plug domain-containing protein, partial [Neisseriaceae bacterium]|nr:TonB-dependent receptor plug domain-containing protein [Neisseriaceae bacterium]
MKQQYLSVLSVALFTVFSGSLYAAETIDNKQSISNHSELKVENTDDLSGNQKNLSGSLKNNQNQPTELETIVVEATRTPVGNMKYAGSVGVLTPQDMESTTNVIDAMMDIAGVDGGMDAGRHAGAQFQIRGFGYQSEDRVIIKQDGIPRSPGLYGNFVSSFRTDTDILKRVEVTKGASSILHGSGAIGGI